LFELLENPVKLVETDMIWTLVLDCQKEEVVTRVIDFLIKIHLSFSSDLQVSRLEVL